MNVLFVCAYNSCRSPTARFIYSQTPGLNARSLGAYVRVDPDDVRWADVIIGMERDHIGKIKSQCHEVAAAKTLIALGIPDRYQFLEADLIGLLVDQLTPILGAPSLPTAEEFETEYDARVAKQEMDPV